MSNDTTLNKNKAPLSGNFSRRALLPMAAGVAIAGAVLPACSQAQTNRLSAEDRLDIIELFSRYAWCYDCLDIDGYVETFAPNGVFSAFGNSERAEGRENIRVFIQDLLNTHRGDAEWQHLNDHHVFTEQTSDSCTAYNYWTLIEASDGDIGVRSNGYYKTQCVKIDGQWYIQQRDVERWDPNQTPWSKA